MIVAHRKSIPELIEILTGHNNVLVLGCGTCVTVCLAGGQREVGIIASALRMASKIRGPVLEVEELTIERQCDNVFIETAAEAIERNDAVLSLGCGAGVQAIAERYSDKPVYAGLDTAFLGILEERGIWTEKCSACGACVLHEYGGVCPITQCAKRLLNGPCGGSREDRCEVSPRPPVRMATHIPAPKKHRPARQASANPVAEELGPQSRRRPPHYHSRRPQNLNKGAIFHTRLVELPWGPDVTYRPSSETYGRPS